MRPLALVMVLLDLLILLPHLVLLQVLNTPLAQVARVSQLLQVMILLNVKSVVKSSPLQGYSIDTLNVTRTLKGTSVPFVAKDSTTPLT